MVAVVALRSPVPSPRGADNPPPPPVPSDGRTGSAGVVAVVRRRPVPLRRAHRVMPGASGARSPGAG
ncbi:hypothetical protein AOB60_29815 [Streptomyces noursei]|uniref:Uncharacterized protein n=1 Tax=Streptomyces noursei TaxID=1971 RepID=A0A2N8PB75_STRNR|nr:hypothetical protein AOB60_29815 [Streptomyces noursei]